MSDVVSADGFFGEFGGAYVPEMLYPNVRQLQECYIKIIESADFQREFQALLADFAGRATPLFSAKRLSQQVGAEVLLKREDLLHTGSHKINNTIGQILLARRLGRSRIIAETGAGQHGVATATVCALVGLPCVVYMGAVDIARQALNVARMRMLGAEVCTVTSGSQTLKDATNEAMRDWIAHPHDTHYIIGSVVGPHPFPDMVARFQSVISRELLDQCSQQGGRKPTHVVACVGGGSNAMGGFYHCLSDRDIALIGVEAAGCGLESGKSAATTALGRAGVLHGSRTIFMQTKDGQVEEAHSVSAGLDYPGIGPQHAHLWQTGRVKYVSVTDKEALSAAKLLARTEGIIPALETAHAIAILERLKLKATDRVVVILSGRGDKDMTTYLEMVST
ncbi:MAG: tryptophan synthase subunit beta [Pseudomonadota bacterium]|jgi:tryptophan synthase beta chain